MDAPCCSQSSTSRYRIYIESSCPGHGVCIQPSTACPVGDLAATCKCHYCCCQLSSGATLPAGWQAAVPTSTLLSMLQTALYRKPLPPERATSHFSALSKCSALIVQHTCSAPTLQLMIDRQCHRTFSSTLSTPARPKSFIYLPAGERRTACPACLPSLTTSAQPVVSTA